jgi:hypothetical protein
MRRSSLLAALLLAVSIGLAPVSAATAATAPALGADVSSPQCDPGDPSAFLEPAAPAQFAVVGVNAGVGTLPNPCLSAEVAWATGLPGGVRAPLELYLNTQHPTPSAAKWWPRGDRTAAGRAVRSPYGHCHGADDRACAWVYGASIADDDLTRTAALAIAPAAQRWWLDVEQGNTWARRTDGNRAVLEGMVASLDRVHAPVGLYSTHRQWDAIAGTVPASSDLNGRATWLSGAVTPAGALARCEAPPLVAHSRVLLAQAVGASGDEDVACRRFTRADPPRLTGAPAAGAVLRAAVPHWSPTGARFAYRWLRDGRAIPGATAAAYRVTAADRHHRLSVRVTGTLAGFDAAVRDSAARRIP